MKTFIFDFDGTIADTFDQVIAVFNMLGKRSEPLSSEEIERLRRMTSRQAIKAAKVPLWRVPGMIKKGMKNFQNFIPTMDTFDGLPDVLRQLHERGDTLYILTSNTEPNVEQFLELHHIRGYFSGLVCEAKLFGKAKRIKKLIKNEHLDQATTYYVGDETRDIAAAHKAGLQAISVTWGFNHKSILEASLADYVISKPRELLKIGNPKK